MPTALKAEANGHQVSLSYADPREEDFASISGTAQVVRDEEKMKSAAVPRSRAIDVETRCTMASCAVPAAASNAWRSRSALAVQSSPAGERSRRGRRETPTRWCDQPAGKASSRRRGVLTSSHPCRMVFHMKTTLNIDDGVMKRLRLMAARSGRTLSELVESALRRFVEEPPPARELPALPSFDGGAKLDPADRDALYRAMERH